MNKPTAAEMNHKVDRALTFVRLNSSRLSRRGDRASITEFEELKNIEEVITICTGRK